MKRDMELIRKLLIVVRDHDGRFRKHIEVEGYTQEAILSHMQLLQEAGYIEGKRYASGGGWATARLTWQGHDFLDAAANETVWRKAMQRAGDIGGSMSVEVLKALLNNVARSMLDLDI